MRKQQTQKFTVLFFTAVFALLQVYAQDKIAKGKVIAVKDNQPVADADATIKLKEIIISLTHIFNSKS